MSNPPPALPPFPPSVPVAVETAPQPPIATGWGPPPPVPWTLRDVFVGLLVPLSFYAVAFASRQLMGDPRTEAPSMSGATRLLAGLLIIIFQLSLLIPVWWWGLRKYGVGREALGLRPFTTLPGCGLVFVALVVGYTITGMWGLFLMRYGLRAQPNPLPLFGEGAAGLFLALLAAGLIAPLTEEIFFRGFMFPAFRDRLGEFWGITLSAGIFGLAHLQPLALPALFGLGPLLAWLYQRTGSLWSSIILHATINSIAILALFAAGNSLPQP